MLPFETLIGDSPARKNGIVPDLVDVKDELAKMNEEFPERETLTSITIFVRLSRLFGSKFAGGATAELEAVICASLISTDTAAGKVPRNTR